MRTCWECRHSECHLEWGWVAYCLRAKVTVLVSGCDDFEPRDETDGKTHERAARPQEE